MQKKASTRRSGMRHCIQVMNEHLIAIIIAFVVVGSIAGFVWYGGAFWADIANGVKGVAAPSTGLNPTAKPKQLPVVYEIQNGKLQLKSTKTFENTQSLSFYLVYDPNTVLLHLEKASSKYEYTYASSTETMMKVVLLTKGNIAANEVIYELPLDGSIDRLTVSDMGVLRANGIFEPLAVQKQ